MYKFVEKFVWNYGSSDTNLKGIGQANADIIVDYTCGPVLPMDVSVRVENVSIAEPIVDLGFTQRMADIYFNQQVEEKAMTLFPREYVFRDYSSIIQELIKGESVRQNSRFAFEDTKEIELSTTQYDVSMDIAIGRIQRNLTDFQFNDRVSLFYGTTTSRVNNIDSKTKTTFKLFPEKNDNTQVVASVSYTPVKDRFTQTYFFSQNDAIEQARAFLLSVDNVLKE
jgi:hypothetical protein